MKPPFPILLIEDDQIDQEKVWRALRPYEHLFALTTASDARQALALLSKTSSSFALIVLDLYLPGLDEFEFLSRLRQHPIHRATPVIVLTSFDLKRTRVRAARYQVAAYLVKEQLDPQGTQLIQALKTCLGL